MPVATPAVPGRSRTREGGPVSTRPVVGWREWVGVPDLGVAWVKAKVDTGARSSSLHAWDLEVDEPAGVVRFRVHPFQHDDDTVIDTEARLVEHRSVRSSNGTIEVRPVVATTVVVLGHPIETELTLTRRDDMGFRMLLGRRTIRRRFLVDPARSFLAGGNRFVAPLAPMPAATDSPRPRQ